MAHELNVYILAACLGGLLSSFLCIYGFFKIRNAPGGLYFILVTFMSAIFTFSYSLELASSSLEEMKRWLMVEYFVLPFIPVFILLMCCEYVGQKLKRWMYFLLYAIPVMTIFIHNTNELHHFYYTSIGLRTDTPFPILSLEGGPWFYVHSLFLYGCLAISVFILIKQLNQRISLRFRLQLLTMIAGFIVPLLASAFYLNGMSPHGIDLGPVFMSITFIFHGLALISFQMFNVAPIARDTVFESMEDGVMVLDETRHLVDFNQAMLTILPSLHSSRLGQPILNLLTDMPLLAKRIQEEKECIYKLDSENQPLSFQIRFTTLYSKNSLPIGNIISFANVTKRVKLEEQLQQLASTDGLTQLLNRTFFLKETTHIFQDLSLKNGEASIILFDIDYFKKVNDTYGHEAGDKILIQVANIAKAQLRESDRIGRYGGEEFVICMPATSLQEAEAFADLIRMNISQASIHYQSENLFVTSSFGIAHTVVRAFDSDTSVATLIREADQALYSAKRNGRNCVHINRDRSLVPAPD